jgi:hypothetical protein
MTIRTRDGLLQLTPVTAAAFAPSQSAACTSQSSHPSHATAVEPFTLRTVNRCSQLTYSPSRKPANDVNTRQLNLLISAP